MKSLQDAGAVVDDMVARGVFRAALQTTTTNAATRQLDWWITWFGGHQLRLKVDEHGVRFDHVLPPLAAQTQLYRDLRVWLNAQQSADLPAHRRIDPSQVKLALKNTGGAIRLSLNSQTQTAAQLTKRAIQLVHAIYLDFLNGPGRLEWVTEAFGLDPDNPRLS